MSVGQTAGNLAWFEIISEADSVYLDGAAKVYVLDSLNESEMMRIGSFMKKNNSSTLSFLPDPDVAPDHMYINLSKNREVVNQSLFGMNVTSLYDRSTLPFIDDATGNEDIYTTEQYDWLSGLRPKTLRWPAGANVRFKHLYNNCDRGWGYILYEIIRYFDRIDGSGSDPDGVGYDSSLDPIDWIGNTDAVAEYEAYLLEIEEQNTLSPGHRYIDDFIEMVRKLEQDNGAPASGYKIDVILCLNIISEPASECLEIVRYLRNEIPNAANYPVNVVGVEMGNETANGFHEKIMHFDDFNGYFDYLTGETSYLLELSGVLDSNISSPLYMLEDHDFFSAFKNTPGFSCKVGVCADGLNDPETVFFTPVVGSRAESIWNEQLYDHYDDIITGTTRYFDAVIMHTYYNAVTNSPAGPIDWWQSAADNFDPPYDCPNWTFSAYDSRMSDDDFDTIFTPWRGFLQILHKDAMADYNSFLHFDLSASDPDKKELWITEYNIRNEAADVNTNFFVNTFAHSYILQEWWMRNLKTNYTNPYRKNFITYFTLQNYAGGSKLQMLTPAEKSIELAVLGHDVYPYSESTDDDEERNYYARRSTFYTMQLLSDISRNKLKYMKSSLAISAKNKNSIPTIFIDSVGQHIYIYYTNIKNVPVHYVLYDGTLPQIYPHSVDGPAVGINMGSATIYAIDAPQPYATSGWGYLYQANLCYSSTNPITIEINGINTLTNSAGCNSDYAFDVNHCITVPAYSAGYIKIPIEPRYPDIGGKQSFAEPQISVFPNPAYEYLFIETGGENMSRIEILDVEGRIAISEKEIIPDMMDIRLLPAGLYQIRLFTAAGNRKDIPFIKI